MLSYGSDIHENFRCAATFMDKMFKGTKPGDLLIEHQPNESDWLYMRS